MQHLSYNTKSDNILLNSPQTRGSRKTVPHTAARQREIIPRFSVYIFSVHDEYNNHTGKPLSALVKFVHIRVLFIRTIITAKIQKVNVENQVVKKGEYIFDMR